MRAEQPRTASGRGEHSRLSCPRASLLGSTSSACGCPWRNSVRPRRGRAVGSWEWSKGHVLADGLVGGRLNERPCSILTARQSDKLTGTRESSGNRRESGRKPENPDRGRDPELAGRYRERATPPHFRARPCSNADLNAHLTPRGARDATRASGRFALRSARHAARPSSRAARTRAA